MTTLPGTLSLAAALALTGCSIGSAEPAGPPAGPLLVSASTHACRLSAEGTVIFTGHRLDNTADIPLTIDSVSLTGAVNITLAGADLLDDNLAPRERETLPAADTTLSAVGEPGHEMVLMLSLAVDPGVGGARFAGVAVDYHNVEGRFRAKTTTVVELSRGCRQ